MKRDEKISEIETKIQLLYNQAANSPTEERVNLYDRLISHCKRYRELTGRHYDANTQVNPSNSRLG